MTAELVAAGVASVGVLVAAAWGLRVRAGRDPLGPRPAGPLPRTEKPLLLAFAAWIVAGLFLPGIARAAGLSTPQLQVLVQLVHAAIAFAILPAVLRDGPRPALPRRRLVAVGVAAGFVTFASAFAVSEALQAVYAAFAARAPEQEVVRIVRRASGLEALGMGVGAVVLAPFAEEVFFRGAMLPFLASALSVRNAVLVQGAIFGAIHVVAPDPALWPLALPLGLVGVICGWLYVRTGSLPVAILVHMVFNALFVMLIRVG